MNEIKTDTLRPSTIVVSPPRPSWGRHGASVIGLVVSVGILVALYRTLDIRLIGEALLEADKFWLVFSIAMILPITFLRAVRFLWVAPQGSLPGVGEAMRLTLVASALNVFLPAKTGDLVKSYFVATRGRRPAGVAISIIVYERLCDLFGLIAWCLLGLVLGRPEVADIPVWFWWALTAFGAFCLLMICSEQAAEVVRWIIVKTVTHRRLRKVRELADGWPDLLRVLRGRRRWIIPFSLLLWFAHVFQIWMFTVALSVPVPVEACASLAALALMAGQLPLTFAGLGTRDVALVVLLSPYMAQESAAAMGVLVATRNFLPPLIGLPIVGPYVSTVVDEARRWRRGIDARKAER